MDLPSLGTEIEFKDLFGWDQATARNHLMESFEKHSQAEYFLFVDNDAGWKPGSIARLIDHKLPMVCGCMYTASIPPRPTMGTFYGTAKNGKDYYQWGPAARAILDYCRDNEIEDLEENANLFQQTTKDLKEFDGCGMHFTLIRRDVVEKVKPPYFVMQGATGAGEDFYFSKKVREAGFPIYADLSVHTSHIVGEREGADFGVKDLLYLSKYLKVEDIVDEGANWEIG